MRCDQKKSSITFSSELHVLVVLMLLLRFYINVKFWEIQLLEYNGGFTLIKHLNFGLSSVFFDLTRSKVPHASF